VEHPKEMVGENHKVEKKGRNNADSHEEVVLTYAKNENSQGRQDIFHDKETHISMINEEVHEGIDFLGSFFNKKDREVGIENREQYKEEERGEEAVAIAVNIQMDFPICPSANRMAASREYVSAEGSGRSLTSILEAPSVACLSLHGLSPETSQLQFHEQFASVWVNSS
jgi:hypothetical protein